MIIERGHTVDFVLNIIIMIVLCKSCVLVWPIVQNT